LALQIWPKLPTSTKPERITHRALTSHAIPRQISRAKFRITPCLLCSYSWFYVVLNIAALLAAPAVDLMRTYVGGSCIEVKAFALPCFSAYRAIIFSVSFPPFFALAFATRLRCQIKFGLLQGFVATAVNFGLSLWMPLSKEVAMGKGKCLQISVSLHRHPSTSNLSCSTVHNATRRLTHRAALSLIFPPGPSNDAKKPPSPWTNVKSVLGSPVFWKFFAFVLFLTGVRLIYRHMDATFPK
jgi:hypothetical protein